jgi:hypothetical protein
MQNSIPDILKSVYVAVCCGSVILVLVAFVWASRRSSVSRTWEPLVPVVNGTLDRKYGSAVLRGTYQERPILATQILGGAENPDTFRIEMTTVSRGANWLVRYGSEKLFGKDQWYLQAGHEKLSQRLTDLDVLTEMQRWQGHPTISYRVDSGTLSYEEEGSVPKPERFQAQLDLLLRFAQINEQVNGLS